MSSLTCPSLQTKLPTKLTLAVRKLIILQPFQFSPSTKTTRMAGQVRRKLTGTVATKSGNADSKPVSKAIASTPCLAFRRRLTVRTVGVNATSEPVMPVA